MMTCFDKEESTKAEFSGNRSIVTVEENKRKYTGNNLERKHIVCFKGEKTSIDPSRAEQPKRCDYIIFVGTPDEKRDVYLIELKGSDYNRAVKQIIATAEDLIFDKCKYYNLFIRIIVEVKKEIKVNDQKFIQWRNFHKINNIKIGNTEIKENI